MEPIISGQTTEISKNVRNVQFYHAAISLYTNYHVIIMSKNRYCQQIKKILAHKVGHA